MIVIVLIFTKNDTITVKVDGVRYAVSVNGVTESSFPAKGSYQVSVECENASSNWNYEKWVAEIYNITGEVSCNISFDGFESITLASKIKSLIQSGQTTVASTSFDDGSTLEIINSALDTGATSNDYRYRGVNPNNYIRFNDELWRIIGVFDQYSHGQTGQELTKIIRDDSIGDYVWDNVSPYNNWEDSYMINLLNTGYYNSANGTGEAYCYHNESSLTGKCDFTSKGIKEAYKSMIQNATWYLGGFSSPSVTSADIYKYERYSDTTNTTYYRSGNATKVEDKPIGLMYASDYGYASPSTCTSNLNRYSDSGCADSNWLQSFVYERTIMSRSSNSEIVSMLLENYFGFTSAYIPATIRPVLYLKSNVYYISGDGSPTNPYVIGM